MLVVVNFLAILVVTAAVVYHYFVFFDTKKKTEAAIAAAQGQAKADMYSAKKESGDNLKAAKLGLTTDLKNTRTVFATELSKTQSTLTADLNKTKSSLSADLNKTKSLLSSDIKNARNYAANNLANTRTGLTNSIATTKQELSSTLDSQFKSLSEQVTTKNTKTGKFQLGDKWNLSGVGEAQGNDDWLRVFGKDGKDYYGGVAMSKVYTRDNAYLNGTVDVSGNLNLKGGASEHNTGNAGTHFPWVGDNKNYIRGDTEIRGNLNNIGDITVGRDIDVKGTMWFGKNDGSTDPYSLRKVRTGNKSSLRFTINDDADEALEIWGNSCASKGGCAGEGALQHQFNALGDAIHQGDVVIGDAKAIRSSGRMHITGGEQLYLLNKNGVTIGKEWGGSGDLRVQGNVGIDGAMKGKTMCVEDVCVTKDQLSKIIKQAGA